MVLTTLIICLTIYLLFGDYMVAKAKLIHEIAREKELANDEKEDDQ